MHKIYTPTLRALALCAFAALPINAARGLESESLLADYGCAQASMPSPEHFAQFLGGQVYEWFIHYTQVRGQKRVSCVQVLKPVQHILDKGAAIAFLESASQGNAAPASALSAGQTKRAASSGDDTRELRKARDAAERTENIYANTIGILAAHFGPSTTTYCTGFLINSSTVVTAGHCVYDAQSDTYAASAEFYPGTIIPADIKGRAVLSNGMPIGPGEFRSALEQTSQYDIAVVKIAKPVAHGAAFFPVMIGAKDISTDCCRTIGYGPDGISESGGETRVVMDAVVLDHAQASADDSSKISFTTPPDTTRDGAPILYARGPQASSADMVVIGIITDAARGEGILFPESAWELLSLPEETPLRLDRTK